MLTTPVDTTGSLYASWVARDSFDADFVAEILPSIPGAGIEGANRLMKPVSNWWTINRRLWQTVIDGTVRREAHHAMARWVTDNPPFPGRAFREWITWMYKENRLVSGRLRRRAHRVDLRRVGQNLLVVTAGDDHITPRSGTLPLLDLVTGEDVTHIARAGGHIGLMAGSHARDAIWPSIAEWLEERSAA